MKMHGREEMKFQIFLTSTAEEESNASVQDKMMGEPKSKSGCVNEKQIRQQTPFKLWQEILSTELA